MHRQSRNVVKQHKSTSIRIEEKPISMLPLFAAFLILALAFRRLFASSSSSPRGYVVKKGSAGVGGKDEQRSSAHAKLVEEAFEFASTPSTAAGDIDGEVDDRKYPVMILYGTEYGFALQVARSVAETLSGHQQVKFYPRVVNVLHFNAVDFAQEGIVVLICSTTGDGVPPNEAAAFRDALDAGQVEFPAHLKYSVLALGDRAYPHFCRAGAIFDELFATKTGIATSIASAMIPANGDAEEKSGNGGVANGVLNGVANGVAHGVANGDAGVHDDTGANSVADVSTSGTDTATSAAASPALLLPRQDIDQEDWDTIHSWTERLVAAVASSSLIVASPSSDTKTGTDPVDINTDDDINDEDDDAKDKTSTDIRSTDAKSTTTSAAKTFTAIRSADDYLHGSIEKYAQTLLAAGTAAQYTRANPFPASVQSKRRLTGPALHAGHKEVVRLELDISGSGLSYEAGDAIGILPQNNPALVNRILLVLASNGDELVRIGSGTESIGANNDGDSNGLLSFETALLKHLDLAVVKSPLIVLLARFSASSKEVALATKVLGYDPRDPTKGAAAARSSGSIGGDPTSPSSPRDKTATTGGLTEFGKEYVGTRHVIDVLSDFPSASVTAQQLAEVLRPLHARYYSISSTPHTSPDLVAVTVDVLRYRSPIDGCGREGVASTFLTDRVSLSVSKKVDGEGETDVGNNSSTKVPVFISHNPNFRLPADDACPVIMIGPGTGIAPFIGFVEQRMAMGAPGENWLFFGCRYEQQDFLYKDELFSFVDKGCLTLRTAFSRDGGGQDGEPKVYVQQRMKECGEKLWTMMSTEKAHVYVCGDGKHMAVDVDQALKDIIMSHGNFDHRKDADAFVDQLAANKRYQRDVWVS